MSKRITDYGLLITLLLLSATAHAASYVVDDVAFPDDMPPEIGGLGFDAEGNLYAALRRGDIVVAKPTADPKAFKWRVFATGHHNPLGLQVVGPGHIIVSQMAELTEIIDTDKDGVADRYNNLSTAWGVSGNYHETNAICPDGEGGYYVAVGTASHNGPTFDTPRGEYSKEGRRGRNFSAVKYKGWVLHYAKDGTVTPHCSGFRMHNGIGRTPDGNIWCGDNQGDWRGPSPLYWCRKDSFSGHPSSLAWDPRFKEFGTHIYLPRKLLDDLYDKPALSINYGWMRSCGEPTSIDTDAFGPFKGQMLIPDENGPRIVRAMLEEVDGAWQGACTLFWSGDLRPSNNRLTMSPDGKTLYVGQTARGWQGPNEGIQRIHFGGDVPFDVLDCKLATDGFVLSFTKPLKSSPSVKVNSFRYEYGYHYGSPQKDKRDHQVTEVSGNGPYQIKVSGLEPDRVYGLTIGAESADGGKLRFNTVEYTLNRLKRPATEFPATVTRHGDKLSIAIKGEKFTDYHLAGLPRPILHPIQGPGDVRMTRDWPIVDGTPGEEHDHPHHQGLFVGHEDVNKVDHWHIGDKCGTIEHRRLIETRSGEDRALVKTFNAWKDKDGRVFAADTTTMTFSGDEQARVIDLEINIHATHEDLSFNARKDSFVGFRSHPDLRLTAKPKAGVKEVFGNAVNSEGVSGKAIWGKRADWVHYYGTVAGKPVGFAFMSHPSNPAAKGKEKSWWHARDYGLVSANPFAFEKDGGDGTRVVPKGDTLQLRYRLVFHAGAAESAKIADAFAAYAKEAAHPTSVMPSHPGYPSDYLNGNDKQSDTFAQHQGGEQWGGSEAHPRQRRQNVYAPFARADGKEQDHQGCPPKQDHKS